MIVSEKRSSLSLLKIQVAKMNKAKHKRIKKLRKFSRKYRGGKGLT